MARIRSIKPEFATDSRVKRLSRDARLTFLLLLPEADDDGRMVGTTRRLLGLLFPDDKDVTPRKLDVWIGELAAEKMVIRYEVDGTRYLAIRNFKKHQNPQHPKASVLPEPPDKDQPPPVADSRKPRERRTKPSRSSPEAVTPELSRDELRGSCTTRALAPLGAEVARPPSPHQAMFAALVEGCGGNPQQVTDSARGGIARAAKELLKVGATPADVRPRAVAYRQKFPNAALTPTALAKHWASCEPSRQPLPARMAGISVLMGGASA